jgi:dTDP-L-rhamnose 4-epimerase
MSSIIITGGAGFIGSWLVEALGDRFSRIVVLDNLLPQVHSDANDFPSRVKDRAICIRGDVRNLSTWTSIATDYPDTEAVVHLAALTGTGQSMYDLHGYDSVNSGGTAVTLEALLDRRSGSVAFPNLKRVVLASSRAIYGEGAYRCSSHSDRLQYPSPRSLAQLSRAEWGLRCDECGAELTPAETPEDAQVAPNSFYGATKFAQELYMRTMLAAAGIDFTILRFQNVFGPGQSLKNPYTGVIGVFYSNIVSNIGLELYEDGQITRDFVFITDVVASIVGALCSTACGTYNVGTGQFTRLADVAAWLCESLDKKVDIRVSGRFRVGDIRHNAGDIRAARDGLGYVPRVSVRDGLRQYVEWAQAQTPLSSATILNAQRELEAAGLSQVTSAAKSISN